MDQAIQPIEGRPVLMRRGAGFTRIIVNHVQAADGQKYHVMFIGTGLYTGACFSTTHFLYTFHFILLQVDYI